MADGNRRGADGSGWELGSDSFLTRKEVFKLRSWLIGRRNVSGDDREAWLAWFIVELGLNSGLRVAEMASLICGDIRLRDELSTIIVRNGKGGKYREVRINNSFQKSVKDFLSWKIRSGEPSECDNFLPRSPRTGVQYTTRSLQLVFKRSLEYADIPTHHSIHHLRHTYASLLYSASDYNLRLVQKQLGHTSPNTTQVYANVFGPDIEKAIEGLMKFTNK
ncbi:MAG: site-specific integrase [Elusimicrobiota bacterium]